MVVQQSEIECQLPGNQKPTRVSPFDRAVTAIDRPVKPQQFPAPHDLKESDPLVGDNCPAPVRNRKPSLSPAGRRYARFSMSSIPSQAVRFRQRNIRGVATDSDRHLVNQIFHRFTLSPRRSGMAQQIPADASKTDRAFQTTRREHTSAIPCLIACNPIIKIPAIAPTSRQLSLQLSNLSTKTIVITTHPFC